MANPLKKSLIYLGLADEELEYDDQHDRAAADAQETVPQPVVQPVPQQAPAPHASSSHAPATARASQKRAPASPAQAAAAPTPTRAPVTPLRRPTSTKIAAPTEMNEILTVHPREYKDAQSIAASFRDGIPVIINLSQMSESDARRLVDFASGLSQGLYGKIERVTNKVFLLSPSHIAVSGDQAEVESDIEASFFAQS
ncbi:cell division protein SepF [Frondihabitans sp. PAMC 28766]|uniref:cell division protein SepF n=1 Tax=Frondihabitans sp. PAMC 28766 TaxID=1795630 RepID=UPI00078E73D3|nr:cell division protein SepF [Frondihabitans sp. PAMC 28766]AMM20729.1 cell division protein SepF [Frondihabitans sp. PAMC 28766]